MSETEKRLPECQICGERLTEGLKLRRSKPSEDLILCYRCYDIINGVYLDNLEEWTLEVKKVE